MEDDGAVISSTETDCHVSDGETPLTPPAKSAGQEDETAARADSDEVSARIEQSQSEDNIVATSGSSIDASPDMFQTARSDLSIDSSNSGDPVDPVRSPEDSMAPEYAPSDAGSLSSDAADGSIPEDERSSTTTLLPVFDTFVVPTREHSDASDNSDNDSIDGDSKENTSKPRAREPPTLPPRSSGPIPWEGPIDPPETDVNYRDGMPPRLARRKRHPRRRPRIRRLLSNYRPRSPGPDIPEEGEYIFRQNNKISKDTLREAPSLIMNLLNEGQPAGFVSGAGTSSSPSSSSSSSSGGGDDWPASTGAEGRLRLIRQFFCFPPDTPWEDVQAALGRNPSLVRELRFYRRPPPNPRFASAKDDSSRFGRDLMVTNPHSSRLSQEVSEAIFSLKWRRGNTFSGGGLADVLDRIHDAAAYRRPAECDDLRKETRQLANAKGKFSWEQRDRLRSWIDPEEIANIADEEFVCRAGMAEDLIALISQGLIRRGSGGELETPGALVRKLGIDDLVKQLRIYDAKREEKTKNITPEELFAMAKRQDLVKDARPDGEKTVETDDETDVTQAKRDARSERLEDFLDNISNAMLGKKQFWNEEEEEEEEEEKEEEDFDEDGERDQSPQSSLSASNVSEAATIVREDNVDEKRVDNDAQKPAGSAPVEELLVERSSTNVSRSLLGAIPHKFNASIVTNPAAFEDSGLGLGKEEEDDDDDGDDYSDDEPSGWIEPASFRDSASNDRSATEEDSALDIGPVAEEAAAAIKAIFGGDNTTKMKQLMDVWWDETEGQYDLEEQDEILMLMMI